MATIGDHLRNVWKNYITPSKEDVKKGRKEEILVAGEPMFPEQKDNPFTKKLSVEKCVVVAEQCPLFMKAARKKTRDSIRAWHRIEHIDKTKKPIAIDVTYINNFTRRNNLKKLWERLRVAAYTTGDGYLLITFDNDENTNIEDSPAGKALPYKVRLINSKYIKEIGFNPHKPEHEKQLIKSFHYEDAEHNKDYWIYPDRIVHMTNDLLFGEFGNSKVNLLRNIIRSSVNVDIATGDILAWFAHGLLDIIQQQCNNAEIKKWQKTVDEHPGAYIHGEDAEIKAIAPQAIDPKPFYEYLILSMAASFFMPTHILTGIQVGKVTGAEIGTGDYVKDLKDDQDLDHNPLLDRLYEMILKGHGRSTWGNYEIIWNPIYIDELSEAEILEKRVRAAEMAYNGIRAAGGFIDMEEARRIFNTGQIILDPTKKVKTKEPIVTAAPNPSKPDKDEDEENSILSICKYCGTNGSSSWFMPEPEIYICNNPTCLQKMYKEYEYKFQLDTATKAMIEKRKAQTVKEKKLGKEILEEQDKDANNNKN